MEALDGKEDRDSWLPDNSSVKDDVRELERQPVHEEIKGFDREAVLNSISKSALHGI